MSDYVILLKLKVIMQVIQFSNSYLLKWQYVGVHNTILCTILQK